MEQTYIAKNELEDRLLLLCNLHRIQTQLLTIILHLLTKEKRISLFALSFFLY